MEIITSHTNADFDALASMVAAKKLYPEAVIVFPGSQEKSMRDFFLESALYSVQTERLRNVDVDSVTRLVIVDNRHPSRLGKLVHALRPGVSVHIYDHHPAGEGDLRGEVDIAEPVGATITLMLEILRQKEIPVTPQEATIFALGLYEETGSLTFASTTERDALAAAYLIRAGARLNVVADFLSHEMSAEQVSVLNDLIKNAKRYDINGVEVVISTLETPRFIPDLAELAHKIRDMESLDVLFLVVQMIEKTHIIGRSRIEAVNAGKVLECFGGGGHPSAASASVKDMTSFQARERLLDELKNHVKPIRVAREIMTSPVKTIEAGRSLTDAGSAMTRFSVNVLPVVEAGKYLGIISREVVQKALFHELGEAPVRSFMTTGMPVIPPDMVMNRVERIMLEERQRFLPVLDQEGRVIGAITRTDLLRSLHETRLTESIGADDEAPRFTRTVKRLMEERLPARVREVLRQVGEIAEEAGFPVYLVGGIVRDLFLRVENLDVDIVVEGDGITFAGLLVRSMGGRIKAHQKFGTAVVVLPDGLKIDIATARLEYYDSPAALPTIELSSIKKDLYRRDFTINTLAVRLEKKHSGELIDFFGGVRDIKEKTIRVLHSLSFIEDPTRVLRAIRFEQRFNFHIGKHTQNLVKTAVSMRVFDRLSGERMYTELVLLLTEKEPSRAIRRMKEFDLLKFIHPSLSWNPEMDRLFSGIAEALTWFRLLYLDVPVETAFLYLLGLFDRLKGDSVEEALARLSVPAKMRNRIRHARSGYRRALPVLTRNENIRPSSTYRLMRDMEPEALLLMMAKAKNENAKKQISLYLTHLRDVSVALTGHDLKALGIPPGPGYKKIMEDLLDAKLDGEIDTRDDELAYAARFIAKK